MTWEFLLPIHSTIVEFDYSPNPKVLRWSAREYDGSHGPFILRFTLYCRSQRQLKQDTTLKLKPLLRNVLQLSLLMMAWPTNPR